MAAGLATLDILEAENAYARLEGLGQRFESALRDAVILKDVGVAFARVGSNLLALPRLQRSAHRSSCHGARIGRTIPSPLPLCTQQRSLYGALSL